MTTLLHPGTQDRYLNESTSEAGSKSVEGSVQSDSILVSLWVGSTSGDLDVTVYTLTDTGKEVEIISFPTVSGPTANLLLRKSAVTLQRFRIQANWTDAAQFEVYVRAITGAGEASARILGSNNWRVSQQTVGTTPVALIPASLQDRQGVLVKSWSQSINLFIAETEAKATPSAGYPIGPRDALALDIAAGAEVWAVAESGTVDCRIAESGGE